MIISVYSLFCECGSAKIGWIEIWWRVVCVCVTFLSRFVNDKMVRSLLFLDDFVANEERRQLQNVKYYVSSVNVYTFQVSHCFFNSVFLFHPFDFKGGSSFHMYFQCDHHLSDWLIDFGFDLRCIAILQPKPKPFNFSLLWSIQYTVYI